MCLPDPPVDPLIQNIPWDLRPLSQFNLNSAIEADYRLDLPVDMAPLQTLLQTVNLESTTAATIEAEDYCLLGHGDVGSGVATPNNQRRPNRTEVSWLRRTEYISSEQKTVKRNDTVSTTPEVYRESLRRPRDVIEAVERGFKETNEWRHPTKPDLQLAKVIPVKPSTVQYDQVIFDADHHLDCAVLLPENDLMLLYGSSIIDADLLDHVRDYDLARSEKPSQLFVIEQDHDEECTLHPIRNQMHLRKHRATRAERPPIRIQRT